MIWASGSLRSERILVLPCPPAPMMAMLTFSLGGTNFGPPSTCRGRIVKAATEVAVAPRNLRRVIGDLVGGVFMVSEILACKFRLSHLFCFMERPIVFINGSERQREIQDNVKEFNAKTKRRQGAKDLAFWR